MGGYFDRATLHVLFNYFLLDVRRKAAQMQQRGQRVRFVISGNKLCEPHDLVSKRERVTIGKS